MIYIAGYWAFYFHFQCFKMRPCQYNKEEKHEIHTVEPRVWGLSSDNGVCIQKVSPPHTQYLSVLRNHPCTFSCLKNHSSWKGTCFLEILWWYFHSCTHHRRTASSYLIYPSSTLIFPIKRLYKLLNENYNFPFMSLAWWLTPHTYNLSSRIAWASEKCSVSKE